MKIIDISVAVDENIPVWPTAQAPQCEKTFSHEKGHAANDSTLRMGLHTGTHIDAPLHFVRGGKSIDVMPLEIFMGPVFVAHLPDVKEITAADLDTLQIPENTTRILFKTSNSALWGVEKKFKQNYVGLTTDAATWLAARNIILIGVDYLSIAKFEEAVEVHNILLGRGIALLEGINLSYAEQGMYELHCLPVKLSNLEAAPVRAVLVRA